MRQQQRILRWQSANGKYSVGNAVVDRIRSLIQAIGKKSWLVGLSMDLVH